MRDAAHSILASRLRYRHSRRGLVVGLSAAVLLHGGVLAAALLYPQPPPPRPLEYVAVRVVPPQALGTPQPARPREPAPQRPAPKPAPAPEAPVLPDANASEAPAPQTRATQPEPADEGGGEEARAGSPLGSPMGVAAFGATRLEAVDPDFHYDYYLDRMLALIHAQWDRPYTPSKVRAVVRFTVQKSGEVSDLEVVEPSGYTAFDLAALRAVQNAGPLPRLPASYRRGVLTVTLIVH